MHTPRTICWIASRHVVSRAAVRVSPSRPRLGMARHGGVSLGGFGTKQGRGDRAAP